MTSPKNHTPDEVVALFHAIEQKFPHKTLGDDKWYIAALSALIHIDPAHAAILYTYLISKPEFTTSKSRHALIRRIREALIKVCSVMGVAKPIEALIAIVKVERPEDRDYTCVREKWTSGPENCAKGEEWLKRIYAGNLSTATDNFLAHKDFYIMTQEVSYGFFLCDLSILGPVETELAVLSAIMMQNLHTLTGWHLRGARRVGLSYDDVETVQQCIELVANFGGVSLHKVPRIADVEHEV